MVNKKRTFGVQSSESEFVMLVCGCIIELVCSFNLKIFWGSNYKTWNFGLQRQKRIVIIAVLGTEIDFCSTKNTKTIMKINRELIMFR
jgi:hypothetical protein